MAGNKIQFGVDFQVDSKGLNSVKASLQEIQKLTVKDLISTDGMSDAQARLREIKGTAAEVENALEKCFNTDLGTLNVQKFNKELKNLNVDKIYKDLSSVGTAGTSAFRNLATEVLTTNVQLKKSHELLDSMAVSMKNTIKWGITSSMMNSFTGSIQKAYGYVKNLDSSLNNIRIVSGQSAEQMADFAQQANNAAKQLGSLTTNYTDAALIYYQQGDSTEEVVNKTNVTIKMANALGESAANVSDYMTAIWNNFDDGSQSLEHYADVITALGASTASSSEEIATGLEKFAAVADATGLSYEYATSALATVVAETRQSADTVGTAFKTLFARIQGLQLGETLDDGTTLNKYSQALEKVGIDIKDQNGELKNMDTILDEMGSKWETLNKDQQLALAQTVAGTRQYNQLVALMDNWDVMNQNLETAANSTGTLQKQQETYLDSVDAHLKTMKASFEDVYDSLLSGDSVKTFADAIGAVASGFADWIDAIGGGGNVLLTFGSIALRVFNNQIAKGITTAITNFKVMRENVSQVRAEFEMLNQFRGEKIADSAYQRILDMKQAQLELRDVMSADEVNQSNGMMKTVNDLANQADAWDATLEKAKEYIKTISGEEMEIKGVEKDTDALDNINAVLDEYQDKLKDTADNIKYYESTVKKAIQADSAFNASKSKTTVEDKEKAYDRMKNAISRATSEMLNLTKSDAVAEASKRKLVAAINEYNKAVENGSQAEVNEAAQKMLQVYEEVNNQMQADATQTSNTVAAESEGASQKFQTQMSNAKAKWNEFIKNCKTTQFVSGMVTMVSAVGQLASAIQSITHISDILNNDDLSTSEKFLQIMMALGTSVPMVMSSISGIGGAIGKITTALGTAGTAATAAGAAGAAGGAAAEGGFLAAAGGAEALQIALGPIGWILLGVTAAVVGLTAAIYLGVKAYNADAEAAKKAAENAKVMAEEADKAKQEVKDLADAFNRYDSAIDKLNSCTKGTQEWRDAIREVNDEVLSLLDKYPQLLEMQGAVERDGDGVLSLSEDAQKALTEQVDQKALTTQAAALATKGQAAEAQLTSDLTDFGRQHTGTINMGDSSYEWNPRDLIEENLGELAGLTKTELTDKLKDILEEPAKNAGMLDTEFNNMVSGLVDSQAEINKLAASAEGAANAWDTASGVIAAQELGDEYGDAEVKIAGEDYEKAYKDSYDKWMEAGKDGIAVWSEYASNDNVKEIWDAYNKANGSDYKMDKDNGVLGTDGEREFQYLDNGEQKKVTLEQVAATIAASEALQSLGKTAEDAAAALNTMDGKINELDFSKLENTDSDELKTGMRDFIANGDFSGMDEGTFSDLKSLIGDTTDDASIEKYLDNVVGDGKDGKISDETAQKYGFDTADKMVKAVKDGIVSQEDAFKKVGTDLVKSVQDGMKQLDLKDLTEKQQQTLGNAMSTAFGNAGKEGMQVVSDIFGALDPSETDEFATALEGIDWNSMDANTLASTLEDAGVKTEFTIFDLENLIGVMQSTGDAAESLSEKFKSIQDITKGLKTGDTISKEDYEKLGPDYEQFFRPMADGTYQLIEEANQFHRIVNEKSIAPFEQKVNEIQQKMDQMNALQEGGKDAIQGSAGNAEGGFDNSKANSQIDFLEATGSADAAQVEEWREAIAAGGEEAKAVLGDLATKVDENIGKFGTLEQEIAQAETDMYTNQSAIASTATSFEELNKMVDEGKITNAQVYNEAFKALYNTLDEDIDTEQLERVTETLEDMAKASEDAQLGGEGLSEELLNNEEAAEDIAESILRFDDAIKDVKDNYKGWTETLEKGDVEGTAEAVEGLRDAYADMLDLDGSSLSDDFLTNAENLELMKQAANGSEEAYNSLAAAAAQDILVQCGMDTSKFEADKAWLDSVLVDGTAFPDVEIGANLNDKGFLNELSNMVNAAGMTAEQATDYLSSMGVDAEVETIDNEEEETNEFAGAKANITSKSVPGTNPLTGVPTNFEIPDITYTEQKTPVKTKKKNKAFALKVTSAKKSSGGGYKFKQSSNGGGSKGSGSGSKGGGGGGGKPKEAKTVDKSKNITDPYHDVNVELKKVQNNLDKISKKQKKLSGQKLFNSMLKEASELERKVDKINEKIKIAQTTDLTQKKGQLNEDAKSAGVTVKYNKDGTIANYAKVMDEAQNNYNAVVEKFNGMSGDEQEGYQETLDAAKESYENFQKSMSDYETLINDTIPKLEQDAQEAIDQAFMRKIEAYRYKIEVTVDLSEAKRDIKDWIAKVNKMDVNPLGQAKLNKDKFSTYFKAKDKETIAKEQEKYRKQENNIIDKRAIYSKKKEKVDDDKAKIESYEKRIKSAEKRLEKAKKTKTKKDDKKIKNQIKSYKDALDAAQKDLAKHKKEVNKAKIEKEKAEKALKGRSNESLNIEIKDRQKKIDSLNKTIKNIQKDTLGKQKKKNEEALKDAQKALNKAKKAQEKAKKTKTKKDDKQAKNNYKDAQQEVNKAKKALAATEKKIKANQKIIDKYTTSKDKTAVAQAEAERKKQAKQVSSAQKELNKAKKAVAAAKKSGNKEELKKAQAAQKKAQKKVKDAEKKLSKVEKKLAKAEKSLDKNAIKALKKQIANLQIEQRKLTALKMKNSFNGQAVEEYIQLLDIMDEATKALTGDSERYGNNTKAALEDLQNQQKSLMGTIEGMQELVEKTYDAWMDSIDEAIAGHEKVTHYYEYQNELLEHNLKLVELLGGAEGSFERLNQEEKILGQELKIDVKNIGQLKKSSQKYYQDYQRQSAKAKEYEAQAAAAKARNDEKAAARAEKNAKDWKEAADKSLTAWENTEKASRDALIKSLETGRTLFETQIDKAKAYAEKQFSGGMGMDNMELEWETQKKIKDQYLDSVNSAYEITKLESKVRKGMDEAKSVTAQNQITKAMKEQLDILKKKDKVSQYEVDRANKVYELTLKQIALEEARNNKNTMKLKRDSQGNYTYEYAADNDAVSQAQDEVNQAQQDLYNFDNEQADAMMEQAMQTFREGQEQIAEAYKAGNTQMAQLLAERYQILTQGYIDQSNIAKDNLMVDTAASVSSIQSQLLSGMSEGGTLDEMANLFKGLSEEGIQSLSAIGECWAGGESEEGQGILQSMDEATKTAMESIQLSITTGLANSIEAFAGEGGLTSIFNTEIENCSKSVENFNNVVDAIQNATTNGASGVTEALNALDNLFYSSEDATSSIWNFNDSVYEQIDATDNAYNSVLDFDEQLNELTNDTANTLDIVEDLTAGAEEEAKKLDAAALSAENAYIEISNLAGGFENEFLPAIESAILATQELINTLSELEDSEVAIPEVETTKKTLTSSQKKKKLKTAKKNLSKAKKNLSKAKKAKNKKNINKYKKQVNKYKKQIKKISAMETGGYTGNWNSKEGRLAVLHEKELVLNKQDTKRVLDAVAMARNMKLNLEDAYKNMLNQANAQKASNLTQSQNTAGTIEQKVEITAEFPGVEKSAEIEQAFNNLINIASQHAYKK